MAQNTLKNPNLSGQHPWQGNDKRSDRANEVAQNTVKNKHLINTGDDTDTGGDTGGGDTDGDTGDTGGGTLADIVYDFSGGAEFLFYYHPDHSGSTGYVTDKKGELYEHIEYFPFGETWIQEATSNWKVPYMYTAKELDEDTQLYYYGARYYDSRTSVWVSADPILGKYLPTGNKEKDKNLSGVGGVFKSQNLGLYTFTHLNPIKLTDPDGKSTLVDINGIVLDVKLDGDLTIYQTVPIGQQGPPAPVGKTHFEDAFISPDTNKAVGRVYLDQSIDDTFYDLAIDAIGMTAKDVALNSTPGEKFDIKAVYSGHEGLSYHGFKFGDKFITTRELGNVLAGFNAASHGIDLEMFQKKAGALHKGGILGLALHEATGFTFGSSPNWGEIDYQRTRSEFGHEMWENSDF